MKKYRIRTTKNEYYFTASSFKEAYAQLPKGDTNIVSVSFLP